MIKRLARGVSERFEQIASDKGRSPLRYAPIFIIGPPRSGSTLLYQCMIERFEVGYFSNLHHRAYSNPALLERVLRVSRWPRRPSYSSRHGRTPGWTGPSEAWRYWYRFFPRHPQYVTLAGANAARLAALRGSMRALGNAFKRPILIKNLPCALRLAPIHEALPEAIYLVMQREWSATGRSILAARQQVRGSYDQWWSVEPPGFEQLAARPGHEQVVEQIQRIYSIIDDARAKYGADRFYDVSFEDFCADAHTGLASVAAFAMRHGIGLMVRKAIPPQFQLGGAPKIDPGLLNELEAHTRLRQL